MRRFLVDAILILALVSIASYMQEPAQDEDIENKIASFEQDVAQHKQANPRVDTAYLNEIEENRAAQFAKGASDFVIDVMDTSMSLVKELAHGLFP